eukprot:scaffold3030_cov305-Prasinococcus_capsulatus_cf.AAC.2
MIAAERAHSRPAARAARTVPWPRRRPEAAAAGGAGSGQPRCASPRSPWTLGGREGPRGAYLTQHDNASCRRGAGGGGMMRASARETDFSLSSTPHDGDDPWAAHRHTRGRPAAS